MSVLYLVGPGLLVILVCDAAVGAFDFVSGLVLEALDRRR